MSVLIFKIKIRCTYYTLIDQTVGVWHRLVISVMNLSEWVLFWAPLLEFIIKQIALIGHIDLEGFFSIFCVLTQMF